MASFQASAATPLPLRMRLWLMMFLQYFVQGCYLPVVSVYVQDALGFSPQDVGVFSSALAVGPLLAPFVIGQLVDRLFPTQYVLAASHFVAGALMLLLYSQSDFWPVVILGTVYSILYVPSLMLTNSLAFHHLANREREFPLVRIWGTLGFVVPAWIVELYWLQGLTGNELNHARGVVFWLSGAVSLAMGLYSLTLPHTPPTPREDRRFAPGEVLRLLKLRHFLVLVLVSFGIAIVHQFHFTENSPYLKSMLRQGGVQEAYEQRISSLGQISELAVMAVLGLLITRLGFKRTMLIGAAAYVARCVILGLAARLDAPFPIVMTVVCIGQALHGLCFGCFLAAAYMYVDAVAPPDIRGSMQNLYGTFVVGGGFVAGGLVAGWVGSQFTTGTGDAAVHDWQAIWLSAAAMAAVCWVAFAVLFPAQEDARRSG